MNWRELEEEMGSARCALGLGKRGLGRGEGSGAAVRGTQGCVLSLLHAPALEHPTVRPPPRELRASALTVLPGAL